MAIHTPHHLQHGGLSPNSPLSHTHSTQPSHEVAGHAAHNILGTTPNTETKFLPLHVFNLHVPMANNVPVRPRCRSGASAPSSQGLKKRDVGPESLCRTQSFP